MIKNLKEYKSKKKILLNYNKLYYDKSSPKIDDASYDKLKQELLNYEKSNKIPTEEKKISQIVGFEPSEKFSKVKHSQKCCLK